MASRPFPPFWMATISVTNLYAAAELADGYLKGNLLIAMIHGRHLRNKLILTQISTSN